MLSTELEDALVTLAGVVDGDEPVDELSHALQCASLALAGGAHSVLATACLFHDVARSPRVASEYPGLPHEVAGAEWLRPRLGEHVAWLVGAHVVAKLYLLETEPGYRERLSAESVRSAVFQGAVPPQPIPLEHPWWPDALRLRRWDDAAKDEGVRLPDLRQTLLRVTSQLALPS